MSQLGAIVVGAGPAGLATSRELARRGVSHRVLERGDRVGHTWAHFYDSLVLHTAKHMSALPGLRFPSGTALFPRRQDFVDYLMRYANRFQLPIETGANVTKMARTNGKWLVETAAGSRTEARAVVIATGIASNPMMPAFPNQSAFRGAVEHSVAYRRPGGYRGQRVLVVGVGNSAGEIAAELAANGAQVTVAVRSGAIVLPRDIAGIPLQYLTIVFGWFPRRAQGAAARFVGRAGALFRTKTPLPPPVPGPCVRVPLIGFRFLDALKAGAIRLKGGIAAFTPDGVRFADGSADSFDRVILATGYRAAIGMLGDQVGVDDCGFARRHSRVVSADQPDLYFVGHNPDIRGGIYTMGRDARRVAKLIASRS